MALFKDAELEAYSRVMDVPERTIGGYSWRTAITAVVVGLFMMPGIMYLNLVVGASVSAAGRWVVVILFMEVMRRSRAKIIQQEFYILFMMAGMMMSTPFFGLIWNQYLVQSPFMRGIGLAEQIPSWVAPPISSESYAQRTFLHGDWVIPIGLICFSMLIGNIDQFGLGLALYYITVKIERLPFPMAPIGAAGSIALAEKPEEKGAWKWRAFSIGSAMGVVWGFLYMGVPILTQLLTGVRYEIFPIPWLETTHMTEHILPAFPTGIMLDMSIFVIGTVVPFWGIIGGAFGIIFTLVLNPILYHIGILETWQPGMHTVQTIIANNIDFYFSFGLGISFSIAVIGIVHAILGLYKSRAATREAKEKVEQTGDGTTMFDRIRIYKWGIILGVGIYIFAMVSYSVLMKVLVPDFPIIFLIIYGALYVPILSYVSARMQGLIGRSVSIPFVHQATIILSGVKGLAVWFSPLGGITGSHEGPVTGWRQMELTGTTFKSKAAAVFITLPVIIIFSLLASQLIWRMGQVPSEAFPFAQKMWALNVQQQAILWTSTTGGEALFEKAWNWRWLTIGLGSGLAMAVVLSLFSLPVNLFYGLVAGIGASLPHSGFFLLGGALFARFYLWKKFGKENWLRYAPVVVAGFGCGMGLAGVLSFGLVLIQRTVTALPW